MQEKTEIRKYSDDDLGRIKDIFERLRALAIEYREYGHLGITGEIAEYEAAIALRYDLWSARNPGFDLTDVKGNRYQVKGYFPRRKSDGSIPTIKKSTDAAPWDYVLLVLLDNDYRAERIYQISAEKLEQFFTDRSNAFFNKLNKEKKQMRAIGPKKFIRLAGDNPIWSR